MALSIFPLFLLCIETLFLGSMGFLRLQNMVGESRERARVITPMAIWMLQQLFVALLLAVSIGGGLWAFYHPEYASLRVCIPLIDIFVGIGLKKVLTSTRTFYYDAMVGVGIFQCVMIMCNYEIDLGLPWRLVFLPSVVLFAGLAIDQIKGMSRLTWYKSETLSDIYISNNLLTFTILALAALEIFLLSCYLDGIWMNTFFPLAGI